MASAQPPKVTNPICEVIIAGRDNNKSGEEIRKEIEKIDNYKDHINTKCEGSFSYPFKEALLNVSENYDLLNFLIDQGVEEIYEDPRYLLNNPLPFAVICLHYRIYDILDQKKFKIIAKVQGHKSEYDIESYFKSNMDQIIDMDEFKQYKEVILIFIDIIQKLLEKEHTISEVEKIELKKRFSYVELYLNAMIKNSLKQQAPQSQNTAAVAVRETDAKLDVKSLKNLYNQLFKPTKGGSRKKRKINKRKSSKRKKTKRKSSKRKKTNRKLSKKKIKRKIIRKKSRKKFSKKPIK